MKDSKGWDGKLRVDRAALVTNPEAGEDPDNYSDEDAPPVEQIEADEGMISHNVLLGEKTTDISGFIFPGVCRSADGLSLLGKW